MDKDEQKILWLALRHIERFGPGAIRKEFQSTGSIKSVWSQLDLSSQQKNTFIKQAAREYELLIKKDIRVLTLDEADYPKSLKNLPDIPPVLYVMGRLQSDDQQAIGVVGSRMVSHYGREVTGTLVAQLVTHGYTIVSGMARGVDAISHQSALEHGGRTIAVWGSGLDLVYPAENKNLARKILENGAIISQFPLGTQAQRFTFPLRNRLVAGLSQAVVVTEARAKSGSLLTAQAAQKYNRPVLAIPGSIYTVGSAGPHSLIKNGAKLVIDAADIVKELGTNPEPIHSLPSVEATGQEKELLDALQTGPHHIDELIRQLPQSPSQVSSLVVMMEIKGLVKHLGDGNYRKV